MSVLLSSCGIILDREINAPDHGDNVFDELNATDKFYLMEQIELIVRLASNDTSKIVILLIASKDISIKFSD